MSFLLSGVRSLRRVLPDSLLGSSHSQAHSASPTLLSEYSARFDRVISGLVESDHSSTIHSSTQKKHEFKQGLDLRFLGVESYCHVEVHNWSREIWFRPEVIFFPKNSGEIATIVKAANANNKRITLIGKGHSWNPLMEGSDYLICTVDMNKILCVDTKRQRVTVEPGATIAEVDKALAAYGLNIPGNIVGTTDITYGGLMATGSHGSGCTYPPMSDLMVEVEMVKPNGEKETFSDATHGKDVMDALRLNLGLFGVMSKITFKVEPAFNVEVTDQNVPLHDLFGRLPHLLKHYQAVEVLWFPFARNVTVKSWRPTDKPKDEMSRFADALAELKRQAAYFVFDKYISKKIIDDPASTPRLMRFFSPLVFPPRTHITDINSAIHYVNEAMNFPIKETELALPFQGPDQLHDVRTAWDAMIKTVYSDAQQGIYTLNLIAHMRFSAGSTAYMSPAYGNAGTAWLDFGSYYKTEGWQELVNKVWGIWRHIPGAKLHWAKEMQRHEGLDLRAMYGLENIQKFLTIRAQFDPKGIFANDFTRRLFGLEFPPEAAARQPGAAHLVADALA